MATGSKSVKYLLIGGGLAAGQAAKQLRESDPAGPIALVGEEPYVPYDRPPLTKEFLRGEKSKDQLLFDPESFFRDRAIDLVLGASAQPLTTSALRPGTASHHGRLLWGSRPAGEVLRAVWGDDDSVFVPDPQLAIGHRQRR